MMPEREIVSDERIFHGSPRLCYSILVSLSRLGGEHRSRRIFIELSRGAIIAKPSQTFKKRQREIKLREKAQLKRQRRLERGTQKAQGLTGEPDGDQVFPGDLGLAPEAGLPGETAFGEDQSHES
jgi:hypothetical protein